MRYGYARSSTIDQNGLAQRAQLEEYGVDILIEEKRSGRTIKDRPEFIQLLGKLKRDDVLVVTKLDRLARNTLEALETIRQLEERGVGIVILNLGGETVNTKSPSGKLIITMLAGIAEFELAMIRERQVEGIKRAKERGVYKGRPKTYGDNNQRLRHAIKLARERDTNGMTMKEIANITGMSRATLYNKLKEEKIGSADSKKGT